MPERLDSNFATVDVKAGRVELARRVNAGDRIPVTVRGHITSVGNDDGTSIEFGIEVTECNERQK